MAETQEQQATAVKPASQPEESGWRDVTVPTDGLPRFAVAFYNTRVGKLLYYVSSDAGRFLRVAVMAAATLGLLYTILHTWSLFGAPLTTIWATFFLDLLITLVATGILYGLRVMAEVAEKQR